LKGTAPISIPIKAFPLLTPSVAAAAATTAPCLLHSLSQASECMRARTQSLGCVVRGLTQSQKTCRQPKICGTPVRAPPHIHKAFGV
jgi:hypothetical protein